MTYAAAGVSIEAGDELVRRIGRAAKKTKMPGLLAGVGGFSALFDLQARRYREPVLVSSTDGVGTKLKIAFATGIHETVGIDLVAMSVNDILTQGAEPLFFLDYFVCGKLDVGIAEAVIRGIARGCQQSGCVLIGGETAEHPGDFRDGEYDLAGFVVGVLEKKKILSPASDYSRRCSHRACFQWASQQRLFISPQDPAFARSSKTEPTVARARPNSGRGASHADAHLRQDHAHSTGSVAYQRRGAHNRWWNRRESAACPAARRARAYPQGQLADASDIWHDSKDRRGTSRRDGPDFQ